MAKGRRGVQKEDWGQVVIMDSAAALTPDEKGQIVVAGSHGSEFAARYIVRFEPFGVILNDAGRGKNDAGMRVQEAAKKLIVREKGFLP